MALPNPTLTFTQTAYSTTGSTTPSAQQVIDAIDLVLGNCTFWEKITKTANYIEIGPAGANPLTNFKALIADDPGAGVLAPDTDVAGIWAGIAPDGGTLGTYNTATPYGGARFSKYWICAKTAVVETVYAIESEETLMIVFRDDSSDDFYAIYFGALWEAPDATSAEADDRIYGMVTSGHTLVPDTWLNTDAELFGHSTGNKSPHVGCFRPTAPTIFDVCHRYPTTLNLNVNNTFTSLGGTLCSIPMFHQVESSPQYFVGQMRQVYATAEHINRVAYTEAAVAQGIIFAPDTTTVRDAILFGNS